MVLNYDIRRKHQRQHRQKQSRDRADIATVWRRIEALTIEVTGVSEESAANKMNVRVDRLVMCSFCQGVGRSLLDDDFMGCQHCFSSGIKPDCWSNETKTDAALKTAKNVGCLICGKKPETVNPISSAFGFDTMEPDNGWIFCNECLGA